MLFDNIQACFFNFFGILALGAAAFVSYKLYLVRRTTLVGKAKKVPISVNYHFSRKCNYSCGFCFHTAKTSHVLSLQDAKTGLRKLKEAGQ